MLRRGDVGQLETAAEQFVYRIIPSLGCAASRSGKMPMQREIEALLTAYLEDRNRESRLLQELLTGLATGAAARQRMIEEFAAAISRASPATATLPVQRSPAAVSDDVARAIQQLRAASAGPTTH